MVNLSRQSICLYTPVEEVIGRMLGGSGKFSVSDEEAITQYYAPMGMENEPYYLSYEGTVVMPFDGKLKNLYFISARSPDEEHVASITLTIRKNGVDTGLKVILTGDEKEESNVDTEISFDAGDEISVSVSAPQATEVSAGAFFIHWGCEITKS